MATRILSYCVLCTLAVGTPFSFRFYPINAHNNNTGKSHSGFIIYTEGGTGENVIVSATLSDDQEEKTFSDVLEPDNYGTLFLSIPVEVMTRLLKHPPTLRVTKLSVRGRTVENPVAGERY